MTIQRMVELLEIEHECILRAGHDDCDRNCADCDLVQDDFELDEMYTDVIALLKKQPEIVRCRDCVNWIPGTITDKDDFIQPRCKRNGGGWSSDDYCSCAERREK